MTATQHSFDLTTRERPAARSVGIVTTARHATGWLRAVVLLRAHGVAHGRLPSFSGRSPRVTNAGRMVLGSHFATRGHQTRPALATGPSGVLVVGDDVFVNQGAVVHAESQVRIGDRVRIGDQVAVSDTDFHEVDPGEGVRVAPVSIGSDVWLARGVVVLPGATIGDGTVVAAGSVVRGELPAWVLAAGSPARPVRDIRGRGPRR